MLQRGIRELGQGSSLQPLLQLASNVKKEVVETLRKIVEIVGKYAGMGLSAESRMMIRNGILSLPNRWSRISSSIGSSNGAQSPVVEPAEQREARLVMALAEESNAMLKNTLSVVDQTVQAADRLFGDRIKVTPILQNGPR
jgi:hypothetical protein